MLKAKWDLFDKFNSQKVLVGYDLGNEYSQISYCGGTQTEPDTISTVLGMQEYNIPTVVCKRKGINQWYYGKEAIRYAEKEGVLLIDQLLMKAVNQEEIVVEDVSYTAITLLTLFVKRSLSLLSMVVKVEQIGAFMITSKELSTEIVEILHSVMAMLSLKTEVLGVQSYIESAYYYMLSQNRELWQKEVLIYDCDQNSQYIDVYHLTWNFKTTPIVSVYEREHIEVKQTFKTPQEFDVYFLDIAEKTCEKREISSIYLIGSRFQEDQMPESLNYLSNSRNNRRIFSGNNIYSKGAVYALNQKTGRQKSEINSVFLGMDKLQINVGMNVFIQGQEIYYPLMDAGIDWYEAQTSCALILQNETSFDIILTPVNMKEARRVAVVLEGFPKRPQYTAKVQLEVMMTSNKSILINVKDLGFGEIYPSSQLLWTQEIILDEA